MYEKLTSLLEDIKTDSEVYMKWMEVAEEILSKNRK